MRLCGLHTPRASRESTSACRRTGPCSQSPFETFLKKGRKGQRDYTPYLASRLPICSNGSVSMDAVNQP